MWRIRWGSALGWSFGWCLGAGLWGNPAFGLNAIHEGTYALWPRETFRSDWRVEAGAIFTDGDGVGVPLAAALKVMPELELGLGLKTDWGHGSRHLSEVPLGLKFQVRKATALNADFMAPVDGGAYGARLGVITDVSHGGRLYSRFSGQIGFQNAFVDNALMAMEGIWIPTLPLGRGISLECGLAASSQTSEFNSHFALDLQPALEVGLGHSGAVLSQVTLGLAGDHRENLRVKIALAEGF